MTVNPDGSVTRTTVTASSGPAVNVPARNYAPGQPLPQTPSPSQSRNDVSTYGYSVYPYPSTGYYYPQPYPQPYYPQPYYPPAPTYNQYYYPPAQPYSGPIHPVPSYAVPPWITSIPLGNGYGYYQPGYGPQYPVCGVCSYNPCRCSHRSRSSTFSIGPGGVRITIQSNRSQTYTTNRR